MSQRPDRTLGEGVYFLRSDYAGIGRRCAIIVIDVLEYKPSTA